MSDSRNRKSLLAVGLTLLMTNVVAAELTDPTRPSYLAPDTRSSSSHTPSWDVESIIVSPARRLAVINGKVVGVNEWVGGARVLEILPYEIRLEYKGETRRISLVPTRVKRPANQVVNP